MQQIIQKFQITMVVKIMMSQIIKMLMTNPKTASIKIIIRIIINQLAR